MPFLEHIHKELSEHLPMSALLATRMLVRLTMSAVQQNSIQLLLHWRASLAGPQESWRAVCGIC